MAEGTPLDTSKVTYEVREDTIFVTLPFTTDLTQLTPEIQIQEDARISSMPSTRLREQKNGGWLPGACPQTGPSPYPGRCLGGNAQPPSVKLPGGFPVLLPQFPLPAPEKQEIQDQACHDDGYS